MDNKLTEAEKLAKMTKEECQNYELEQLKKKLADYEKAGARTELARTAREMLVQVKAFPVSAISVRWECMRRIRKLLK
jgi:cytosine/adenosine deaminase-related metal-dependent hydrolase